MGDNLIHTTLHNTKKGFISVSVTKRYTRTDLAAYRSDIQVLRGLAVLLVIGFHSAETILPLGYLGVDIFFVISGYVISPKIEKIMDLHDKNLSNGKKWTSFFQFLENRFWRLSPALISSLILSAVLVLFFAPVSDHERFSKQGLFSLIGVGNIGAYLFHGDYFSPNPNPLIHLWSLSVEVQFYVLIPIFLLITLRFLGNKETTFLNNYVVLSVISFITFFNSDFMSAIYAVFGVERYTQFTFYSTLSRIWQFGLGGLLYVYEKRRQDFSYIFQFRVLFLALFCITLANFLKIDRVSSSLIITILSALMIHSRTLESIHRKVELPLVWLGYRSYSIYLIHMPVLYTIKFSPVLSNFFKQNFLISIIFGIIFSIILGGLNYSLVESKFRRQGSLRVYPNNKITFKMIYLLTPMILAVMMIGVKNHYWGLEVDQDKHIRFAGEIDLLCERLTSLGPPCEYLVNGSGKTILLIGDSYATQISQAVIETGNSLGWNVFVSSHANCPVQFSDPSHTLTEECMKSNLLTLQWIQRHQPDSIIVANRLRLGLDVELIKDAIYRVYGFTPNLIVVGNTPEFPDPDKFNSRRPLLLQLFGAYEPPKKLSITQMSSISRELSNDFLNQLRIRGIDSIDLWRLFCDKKQCRRYDDVVGWLYVDANHLSVSGANFLKPVLLEAIGRW